ncbi:MAG TPA: hypothetical protein VGG48_15355 [Rhizomicrobium sp.]|jgi:hypothetical protein
MAKDWRKSAIAGSVLALHALLILVLIRMQFAHPSAPTGEVETTLLLPALPAPQPKSDDEKKKEALPDTRASHTITVTPQPDFVIPKDWKTPGISGGGLPGVSASLGCSAATYESLSPAERAACGHGPWKYDHDAHETVSLMVPPPPHVMSAMERAERIRSTADPCLADKAMHMDFCVNHVIYGDKLP